MKNRDDFFKNIDEKEILFKENKEQGIIEDWLWQSKNIKNT